MPDADRRWSPLDLVRDLHPLHRTLVSDGTDEALARIGHHLGPRVSYAVERYEPGAAAWTWRVPERWVVHEAYLECEDGSRIADFAVNPLHLVSYSEPVDVWLTLDELRPHLRWSEKRPGAIPWEFAYYERTWGFCISKDTLATLRPEQRYHAVIRSELRSGEDDGLAIGVAQVGDDPAERGLILLSAHVCHPCQANDDLAGVATAVEVMRRLGEHPLGPAAPCVRLLVGPETIGSICYLSRHEDLIPMLRGAVFCEMTGNDNSLVLQRSRQDDAQIDRIARSVLSGYAAREGAFRDVVGNDEIVINGPGVDCPCVSISRWPYAEYHTSDDTPAILTNERMTEAADAVEAIVRRLAANYVPVRQFTGPVMLSAFGLWVDWREDPELNHAIEKIMLRLEGDRTVHDIALELGLDFWTVHDYVERFRAAGLVIAGDAPGPHRQSSPAPIGAPTTLSPAPASVLAER